MIEKGKNIGGKLRHGEHGSAGNARKAAHGKRRAQFRDAVAAQVGNDGANACKLFREGTPIVAVERRGMQENDRQARAGVTEAQPRAVCKINAAHTPAYTWRIRSRQRRRLFGNADPGGQIGDADQAAREEEANDGKNADQDNIPAVGLCERQADSADLAADARPDERTARHGLRHRANRAAARAEARAMGNPVPQC